MISGNQKRSKSIAKVRRGFFISRILRRRTLPIVYQNERAECALACLAMVAGFYGHEVDLLGLRGRFSVSLKGMGLSALIRCAGELGMSSNAVRVDLDELSSLQLPCIVHWEGNHFVVLKKVSRHRVDIHDPARGPRKVSMRRFSDAFTGIALELMPRKDFVEVRERTSLSLFSMLKGTSGIYSSFLRIGLLAIVLEMFNLVNPLFMQLILDHAIKDRSVDVLTVLTVSFGFIALFRMAASAARTWSLAVLSSRISLQWASGVIHHMLGLPLSWFEKRHIGDVVSRFGSVGEIRKVLTSNAISSILDGVMSIAVLSLICVYSFKLAFIVFLVFAIYATIRMLSVAPLRRSQKEAIFLAAAQQTDFLETVRGVLPIKLADKMADREYRYVSKMASTLNQGLVVQRMRLAYSSIGGLTLTLGRLCMVWYAARLVIGSSMSVGMLVAFLAYADQFMRRASGFIDRMVEFGVVRVHLERLSDIVLSTVETSGREPATVDLSRSIIELRNVGYRYSDDDPQVLRNLSFSIKPGESIAIVGPSGVGKTTLAKILLGLIVPTEGEVLLNGVNLSTIDYGVFRSDVGAVMQNDQLFAGTLEQNISFFENEVDMNRVIEAARAAAIHNEIARMPMGYDTLVGDMGTSLSGGQKQRVILARALYKQPKLLVLDEATSHLDERTEYRINDIIGRLEITRVVIAHREATIRSARRVIDLSTMVDHAEYPSSHADR